MFEQFLNLLFPPRCLACRAPLGSAAEALCAPCESGIAVSQTLRCGECFARIPGTTRICHNDFPYLLGTACFYHDERVRALVHGLKFRHAHAAAATLARLLHRHLQNIPNSLESFTIIPLPLSHRRERQRGYNQSRLIAETLAPQLALPIADGILVRTVHTKKQSEIVNWEMRHTNVAGAFAVAKPELAKGRDFILLDDVTTSGATFFEAATALKRAGARHIIAAAAARA
ncbi:MAG: ComF family protein [Candidatus Liptonbacteria bacterium]|nr:ComF family protein [Candidatus Liptonbacteria bacterium]